MIRGTDPHQLMLINIIITALDFSSRAEKSSLSSLSSGCDWVVTLWKDVGSNGANVTCRPTPSVHSFIWVSFYLSVPLNAGLLSMWAVALHFPRYPFISQGLCISVEKLVWKRDNVIAIQLIINCHIENLSYVACQWLVENSKILLFPFNISISGVISDFKPWNF